MCVCLCMCVFECTLEYLFAESRIGERSSNYNRVHSIHFHTDALVKGMRPFLLPRVRVCFHSLGF